MREEKEEVWWAESKSESVAKYDEIQCKSSKQREELKIVFATIPCACTRRDWPN